MSSRIVLILAALFLLPGLAWARDDPAATSYLVMGTPVDWKIGAIPGQYMYSDQQGRNWTVRLRTQGKVDGKPKYLRMTVSTDGVKPMTTSFDIENAADFGTLGVYDFDPGTPSFVVTDFSMGAHCCTDVQALIFDGQKLVAVDAGSYDGGGITVRDLDGDGSYEMEGWDQRFYYAFDAYAGSLPARKIQKLSTTGIEDVTTNREYQAYMVGQVIQWLKQCYETPAPGACAGALGTAAKAGLYQSAAADIDFNKIDKDNPGADYLNCTKERCGVETKFWNYREALEFQLNDWGYNTDSSMKPQAKAFFGKLAAFGKGFGVPDGATSKSCGEHMVRISVDKAGRFARLEGHEYACRVEKATILDSTAVGLSFCSGEGEDYSALLVMELKQDTLYMTSVFNGAVSSDSEPEVLPACR